MAEDSKAPSAEKTADKVAAVAAAAPASEAAKPVATAPAAAPKAAPVAAKAGAPEAPIATAKPGPAAEPAKAEPVKKAEAKAAPAPAAAPKAAAPKAVAPKTAAPVAPAAKAPTEKPAMVKAPAKPVPAKRPALKVKRAATPAKSAKPAITPKPAITAKPAVPVRVPPFKSKPTQKTISPATAALSQMKDTLMAKTTADFTKPIKTAITELQGKAKAAYEKGTGAFGDANEFAKGNVEAVVESGKILATGLQGLGTTMVTDSRSAFDALTAEMKQLAAAKSPTEFFTLQSTLARKNFDSMVAHASKSSEAMLKLANDVMAPISNRVSIAVEKAGKAL